MRRGFKAEAERLAAQVRTELGLGPYKPMDIKALARHVGAQLRAADELTSLAKLEELEGLQPGAFSACTFDLGARKVIVVSPLATEQRRQPRGIPPPPRPQGPRSRATRRPFVLHLRPRRGTGSKLARRLPPPAARPARPITQERPGRSSYRRGQHGQHPDGQLPAPGNRRRTAGGSSSSIEAAIARSARLRHPGGARFDPAVRTPAGAPPAGRHGCYWLDRR